MLAELNAQPAGPVLLRRHSSAAILQRLLLEPIQNIFYAKEGLKRLN